MVVDGTVGAPYTWMYMQIQRITRASHCANVVWPDLAEKSERTYTAYSIDTPTLTSPPGSCKEHGMILT
jgi:hypothetical protein